MQNLAQIKICPILQLWNIEGCNRMGWLLEQEHAPNPVLREAVA